ncbi:UNKNOWN [Stylonychia lemnae]|uniref:Uncharacterized protein n=1 Tax=Stylonychia lemnae TaxID=5949 RepID=A0A078B8Z2_STYLE|nr:UNKNOWN [Stylonychia lemnae]|eukprot:CDW90706.1 UNKNOWN [Stylonychia lemnae]
MFNELRREIQQRQQSNDNRISIKTRFGARNSRYDSGNISPSLRNENRPQMNLIGSPREEKDIKSNKSAIFHKPSSSAVRMKLQQRIMMKMCSKFGANEKVAQIVQEAIVNNLANQSTVNPQVFDKIEQEISKKVENTSITNQGELFHGNSTPHAKLFRKSFFGQSPIPYNKSVTDYKNKDKNKSVVENNQTSIQNQEGTQNSTDLKKEYYRQLVNVNVPNMQTKQVGPVYNYKQLQQFFNQSATQPTTPISSQSRVLRKVQNPNNISDSKLLSDDGSYGHYNKLNPDATVKTIKQNFMKLVQNPQSPSTSQSNNRNNITGLNKSANQANNNKVNISIMSQNENPQHNKTQSFHNLLRASFGSGKRFSENGNNSNLSKLKVSNQVNNDQLWKMLETFNSQKEQQKVDQEIERRKFMYQKYKKELSDQFKMQEQLDAQKKKQRQDEINQYKKQELQFYMDVENQKFRKKREQQALKEYQIKTISINDLKQKQALLFEKQIENQLKDGPKEIIEMDEYQKVFDQRMKDLKLKDDLVNLELIKEKQIKKVQERIEVQQTYQKDESFLDRLRRKDYEYLDDTKMRSSAKQDFKILAASFRVDLNGEIKVNEKKTIEQLDKENEVRAAVERQKQEDEQLRAELDLINKSKEVVIKAQEANKELVLMKDQKTKIKQYLESKKLDDETLGNIYATLKLPNIMHSEEYQEFRKSRHKLLSQEYIELAKQKKEIKPDIRDLEIILNKDTFEEMGLL